MQKVNPSLQVRIIKQQIPSVNNSFSQYVFLPKDKDMFELSVGKQEENKKKNMAKKAAVLAVAALSVGFVVAKKGNFGNFGNMLQDKTNKLQNSIASAIKKYIKPEESKLANAENVRKFFVDNKQIKGVKLEKGKAVLADGSPFSGTMETIAKSGKKVSLEYYDGFIAKSKIDDKLHKTYIPAHFTSYRSKGVMINSFDQEGRITERKYQFFNNDGTISKSMKQKMAFSEDGKKTQERYKVLEFSKNRKRVAQYETDYRFMFPEGKVFNEDGTIKKEFAVNPTGQYSERTYLEDGTKIVKLGGRYPRSFDEQVALKEIVSPKEVIFINKDKKLYRSYAIKQEDGAVTFVIGSNKIPGEIKMQMPYDTQLGKDGEMDFYSVILSRSVETAARNQKLQIFDDVIKNATINGKNRSGGFTKNDLSSTIEELEQAIKVAEDNGILHVFKSDRCEISYDRFRKYIQQLKEYLNKM